MYIVTQRNPKYNVDMKCLFNDKDIQRSIVRMAHEIIEKNQGTKDLVLVGIKTRGIPLAYRIQSFLEKFESEKVEVIELDITHWRDDSINKIKPEVIQLDITNKICVIVDDVFFSGRTIRAAMDAIIDHGRPKSIQLAVLVDRGHRELPIRADYVGKNIPTSHSERVFVRFSEVDNEEGVFIDKQSVSL